MNPVPVPRESPQTAGPSTDGIENQVVQGDDWACAPFASKTKAAKATRPISLFKTTVRFIEDEDPVC